MFVIEGFINMTAMPLNNYKNGLSVQEGVVNGVRSFVVNSSNEILNFNVIEKQSNDEHKQSDKNNKFV